VGFSSVGLFPSNEVARSLGERKDKGTRGQRTSEGTIGLTQCLVQPGLLKLVWGNRHKAATTCHVFRTSAVALGTLVTF
jgi:hypothetical protein